MKFTSKLQRKNVTRYTERKYNTLYGTQKNVHATHIPDTTRNARYTKCNAERKMDKT